MAEPSSSRVSAAADDGQASASRSRSAPGELRTRLSDGIVGLFKEYYGRGPDQVRVYYVDDVVVCVMRGGFTRIEQTLLDAGRRDVVIEQRITFQEIMSDRFKSLVQEITGRVVIGFVSGNQPDPEMTCEVFVLGHEAGGGG